MKNWRVVGIDDSFSKDFCCIVGCVMSGRSVEGFMYNEITVDGLDSTEGIISMLKRSKFFNQLKCVFLNGITFGGFNVADISEIYARTGIPVIVIMGRKPNMEEFRSALKNLSNYEERIAIVERAGDIYRFRDLYLQLSGLNLEEAERIVEANILKGKIPEALRIAHLVASAIVHGESKNR
ncbi:MAG: uncharacterized protein PWQ22_1171 [Archaeoglobaceae archaeon]|nr:uncharacterized protein [Archaeoglobaceae archaeon]MDK2876761.1 uncharacterized protein [Archaeoglobaceae archaeon]